MCAVNGAQTAAMGIESSQENGVLATQLHVCNWNQREASQKWE